MLFESSILSIPFVKLHANLSRAGRAATRHLTVSILAPLLLMLRLDLEAPSPIETESTRGDYEGKNHFRGGSGMRPSCRFFASPDGCLRGADCHFRHEVPACRFFSLPDGCARGATCRYRHEASSDVELVTFSSGPPEEVFANCTGKKVENLPFQVLSGSVALPLSPRDGPVLRKGVALKRIGYRQWSFGKPQIVNHENELATLPAPEQLTFVQVLGLRVRFEHFGLLPNLVKLVFRCGTSGGGRGGGMKRNKPVYLEGLFRALAGHPSLTWLDVSGHRVDRSSDTAELPVGSAELRKMIETTPQLACLNMSDRCFRKPLSFMHFLVSIENSRLVKVQANRNVEFFADEDLAQVVEGEPVCFWLIREAMRAIHTTSLVELNLWPDLLAATADSQFVSRYARALSVVIDRMQVAYFAPFSGMQGTRDSVQAMVELLANARRWTPARHCLFPWAFQQATLQVLLLASRNGIPREVVHEILERLAWHYPIAPMELDNLNHALPLQRQIQLLPYFQRIKFPLDGVLEMQKDLKRQTHIWEAEQIYTDDRHFRSYEDRARDRAYLAHGAAKDFEELLFGLLRQDNSELSTQLTLSDGTAIIATCFVHREMDYVVYETIPRSHFLSAISRTSHLGSSTCTYRTFMPPRSQPRKIVRNIVIRRGGEVWLVPPEESRLAQTQYGRLEPEAFTTYL